jgi:hypothetical protein
VPPLAAIGRISAPIGAFRAGFAQSLKILVKC